MRRLTLDVEMLQVESFETAAEGTARGTVRGHAAPVLLVSAEDCLETADAACSDGTICFYSCGGTCGASPPYSWDGADCPLALAGVLPPPDCV